MPPAKMRSLATVAPVRTKDGTLLSQTILPIAASMAQTPPVLGGYSPGVHRRLSGRGRPGCRWQGGEDQPIAVRQRGENTAQRAQVDLGGAFRQLRDLVVLVLADGRLPDHVAGLGIGGNHGAGLADPTAIFVSVPLMVTRGEDAGCSWKSWSWMSCGKAFRNQVSPPVSRLRATIDAAKSFPPGGWLRSDTADYRDQGPALPVPKRMCPASGGVDTRDRRRNSGAGHSTDFSVAVSKDQGASRFGIEGHRGCRARHRDNCHRSCCSDWC